MSGLGELKIFAGRNSVVLGERVSESIGMKLGDAKTHVFPDGELMVKLEEDVRGRDCFVILSTCAPVNDNIMELLIFTDCLRRASANRVTLVVPYYGYARQDRKSEGRTPITAKLVANLMTASNADRVLAIDLHAPQIQGFFDLPVDHLSATPVFYEYFERERESLGEICFVSPDVGNLKVAEGMAGMLNCDNAVISKRRMSDTGVEAGTLMGDVDGKTVLMFDDMISTGGTVLAAADFVRARGARQVIVAATHSVMAAQAAQRLGGDSVTRVVTTDTIPISGEKRALLGDKLVELSVGPLLGNAIRNIHEDRSVSALFKKAAIRR